MPINTAGFSFADNTPVNTGGGYQPVRAGALAAINPSAFALDLVTPFVNGIKGGQALVAPLAAGIEKIADYYRPENVQQRDLDSKERVLKGEQVASDSRLLPTMEEFKKVSAETGIKKAPLDLENLQLDIGNKRLDAQDAQKMFDSGARQKMLDAKIKEVDIHSKEVDLAQEQVKNSMALEPEKQRQAAEALTQNKEKLSQSQQQLDELKKENESILPNITGASVEHPGGGAIPRMTVKDAKALDKELNGELAKIGVNPMGMSMQDKYDAVAKSKVSSKPIKMSDSDEATVKTLATANANKIGISNQIESSLKTLEDPKVDIATQIAIGEQLIKTLNSTEGKDAVGVDEAKRLAGLLHYNFGNPKAWASSTGSFWGRDFPGFVGQVRETMNNVRGAVQKNQATISGIEKGYGITSSAASAFNSSIGAGGGNVANAGAVGSNGKPVLNSTVTQNGVTYRWNGTRFESVK